MNPQQIEQLLGGQQQYGEEFFAQSPAARLERLKLQKAAGERQGTPMDPTGEALLGLLTRRVAREEASAPPLTSAEDGRYSPQEAESRSIFEALMGVNPYPTINNTLQSPAPMTPK